MREGTAGVRSSMLGPPAVYNTAGTRENHAFSRKRHPADVRPRRGPVWQGEGLAPGNYSYFRMASTPQARLKRDALSGSEGRLPSLHILFVHSHAAEVERC